MGSSPRELPLETPLFEALGARALLLRPLEKLGLKTVGDLLMYFPVRYEDFTQMSQIADLIPGQQVTIQAAIEDVRSFRTRRGLTIVEAVIADESSSMKAVWFNQPYVNNTLHAGRIANFSGKVSSSEEKGMYFSNPRYEIVKSETQNPQPETAGSVSLVSIYAETRGITSRGIRYVVERLLRLNPLFSEWIPQPVLDEVGIPEINEAIRSIHLPNQIDEALMARRRFSFEKLFLLQLWNLEQKFKLGEKKAPAIPADIERLKAILAKLPFALTASQKQSLWDVIQNIEKPTPMNRLLQGDVGSGKTIVAALAAIISAEAGYQTAFMAPTEILVRQHFQTMQKLIARIGAEMHEVTVGLITANGATVLYPDGLISDISKKECYAKVITGEIRVVFGTHALIQKAVSFKNLGLVVIDEQHRFGVRQRQALVQNRESSASSNPAMSKPRNPETAAPRNLLIPHFLSMSATPIPRTLTLTIFGDLDLSLITELPAGRKPIQTKIIPPQDRAVAYAFIRKEIKSGRQAFVICPRIEMEDDEAKSKRTFGSLELKSVKEEYEKLSKKIFPELRVAMLHGQMKAQEKEDIMREFAEGRTDILVSTSVIEVGVDVPNATIMMIEGTDRFGLAQLYQFRGRVGRGEHQSYCFLMSESTAATTKGRLQAILRAKNGFELAEYDLKLRGPGEFFGQAQSGFSDVAMAAVQNPELVKISRESAVHLLRTDPTLASHLPLKQKLIEFEKMTHRE